MFEVHSFVNSPVTSNCYVLFGQTASNECIIVDPGSKDEKELLDYLWKEKLEPKYIILTHEHFDHCWGVNQLVEKYSLPIVCSELCADAIKYEKRNCSVFYDNMEAFTIKTETISVESINNTLFFYGGFSSKNIWFYRGYSKSIRYSERDIRYGKNRDGEKLQIPKQFGYAFVGPKYKGKC